ncbi:thioredoxin-1 [[Candida] anglica]|uniref:Thioredoxin n=1 Tax=[Candida] anglica TaxID=148631 RepID=A0ABP0EKZ2_9ASCO
MVQILKTKGEFDTALEYEGLVVVDFFATWCGPCKAIAPTYETFPEKYPDARFYKVDVDESKSLAQLNNITAMPTFVFFRNGEEVDRVRGADLHRIIKILEEDKKNHGKKH